MQCSRPITKKKENKQQLQQNISKNKNISYSDSLLASSFISISV